ncbi:hypothetical protein PUV54_14735 [Hyphococcus flavus]|uniref:Uncharacterized protein n=1 Tax=Hyphococcus flavus TaxID=1866326 RepID=A0AAE9ZCW8_9PROT|nr:hypothetical protein [Hyphococcus flavus]WDI31205.1 hypothetical protein PUV54_14735 [Hyphococcus flavus]
MTRNALLHWRSKIGAVLVAAVAVFALSQILVSAHASAYGDGPHDHGGQVCVLSLVAPHVDKAIATAAVAVLLSLTVWRAADQITQSEHALQTIRAARPRGPPSR